MAEGRVEVRTKLLKLLFGSVFFHPRVQKVIPWNITQAKSPSISVCFSSCHDLNFNLVIFVFGFVFLYFCSSLVNNLCWWLFSFCFPLFRLGCLISLLFCLFISHFPVAPAVRPSLTAAMYSGKLTPCLLTQVNIASQYLIL